VVNTDGARLETNDNSCVTPSDLFGSAASTTAIPVRLDGNGLPINAFKNYQYTGTLVDNATMGTLDRTREGYMEVLEMAVVTNTVLTGFIKHGTNGVPANCAALDAYDAGSPLAVPTAPAGRFPLHLSPPAGGLTGRASIINAPNGTNFTSEITAVDNWWVGAASGGAPTAYSEAGNVLPRLANTNGTDLNSAVFVTGTPGVANSAGVVTATWLDTRDAVTSIFMRDTIVNEFVTDAATLSKTDWVITMPTKSANIGVGTGTPRRPFSNNFANATATGACDAYLLAVFNREEGAPGTPTGTLLPSPRPAAVAAPGQVLCWEANMLEFGTSGLLGSTNNFRLQGLADPFVVSGAVTTGSTAATLSRRAVQGPNGWAQLAFGASALTQNQQVIRSFSSALNGVPDAVSRSFFGLPVIGEMYHSYTNTGVTSSYGGVITHKYTRFIQ
jgi:hypothetical protein